MLDNDWSVVKYPENSQTFESKLLSDELLASIFTYNAVSDAYGRPAKVQVLPKI